MSNGDIIRKEVISILMNKARTGNTWLSEYQLEDFFEAKGYDIDIVRNEIDELFSEGTIDACVDSHCGGYFLAISNAEPELARTHLTAYPLETRPRSIQFSG